MHRELHDVCLLSVVRALWPFEAILVPKRHILRLTDLREEEKIGKNCFSCAASYFVLYISIIMYTFIQTGF